MSRIFAPETPPVPPAPIRTPLFPGFDGGIRIKDNEPWSKYFELQNQALVQSLTGAVLLSGTEQDRPPASSYPIGTRYFSTDTTIEYEVASVADENEWVPVVRPVFSGTHAGRLTTNPAEYPIGTFFLETDRKYVYSVQLVEAVNEWVWQAGIYVDLIANQPADLGPNDKGALFIDSTALQQSEYCWIGTQWVTTGGLLQLISDAATNALTTVMILRHLTSGAATQGFGLGLRMDLQDAAGSDQEAALDSVEWSSAAATSTIRRWWIRIAGILTDALFLDATGLLTAIGNLAFKAGTAFAGTLTAAMTAARTWTLPDESGNVVYQTAGLTDHALVLGSGGSAKVKGGPLGTATTVLHGNAAGDPTFAAVSLTLDVTGVLNIANGGTSANTAAGARTALSAAQSGINNDITQLTGLTTPLVVTEGGTGSGTAAGARTNLAAAQNNGGSIAAGTYTVGAKLTGGGNNGTITINADGVITAITPAS